MLTNNVEQNPIFVEQDFRINELKESNEKKKPNQNVRPCVLKSKNYIRTIAINSTYLYQNIYIYVGELFPGHLEKQQIVMDHHWKTEFHPLDLMNPLYSLPV